MRFLVILWRKPIFKDMFFFWREKGGWSLVLERERERGGGLFLLGGEERKLGL